MKSALKIDALREAVAKMPNDRLSDARLAALQHLDDQGTPTTRHEDWKYTNLASVIDISNQWLAEGAGSDAPPSTSAAIDAVTSQFDADWLIIANGKVDLESIAVAQDAGIGVALLSESGAAFEFDAPLADLNIALLHDGLRLRIEAESALRRPIGILFIDNATAAVGVTQARVEIELAEHSEASFIEYHASSGTASHYANTVVNLDLGNNATANYLRIQDRNHAHSQTSRLCARLDRDSCFRHCAFDLGGKLTRNDLNIQVTGPGSSASFHGLYLASDGQHIDNHTRIDHRVGPARSRQEYRGILSGSSRCVWNGKVIVHAGADGTDAEQANHNLLLSEKAEIDAKPELEIYADDVKCAHGTTIGTLDEEALFYLRTRGLDQREAAALLIRAFAQSIVNLAPIAAMQKTISDIVADRVATLIDGVE
ncbi:MAG: Fe-S cluster assembly protein SufD [Proteobacteria bacterium]|nr:Fe-S cluster assembly protein SufD [Pseudomonadota bacterium]